MMIALMMLMFVVPLAVLVVVDAIRYDRKMERLKEPTVSRVAFGSCLQQWTTPQPIWSAIESAKPDVFVFIGDNIYADTENMIEMAQRYQQLSTVAEYARFRSKFPVLATWDDHDFGINDGGKEYPKKEESKKLMLDFFGEPQDSERRKRPGVYTSYSFGPTGQRLQLILLDLRWFRDPIHWDDAKGGYVPTADTTTTIMGEQQWSWLEAELSKPADLRIIASSIQFSSPDHGWEKWANFPHEKRRLLDLLDRLNVRNAVVISGDMHFGELSSEKTARGVTVYDLTSSGLTFYEAGAHYPNRNRIAVHDRSINFGLIEIDWQRNQGANVSLQVRDGTGNPVIRHDISL